MTKKGGTRTVPRPTEGELEILRVLWEEGPSTVRTVHEVLAGDKEVGYTTVLKLLQIMHDKGLVDRDESSRAHIYEARASRERTQEQMVADLLDRAFAGSASQLVLRALQARPASDEELERIREMLDRMEAEE